MLLHIVKEWIIIFLFMQCVDITEYALTLLPKEQLASFITSLTYIWSCNDTSLNDRTIRLTL